MGNELKWQERYNIGIEHIDREHRRLFNIINRLLVYSKQEEKREWICQEGVKYFKDHAMKHFTEEEAYMASIHYSGFEMHRRLHDNFRQITLPELEKELKQTEYAPEAVEHFLGVCIGWLVGHTLTEDFAITGKTRSKWVGLVSEQEQQSMKQVIIQLLYDMFRLESRVISDHYGGEKFGNGIYYRLVYGNSEEEWEIFLVFEERLLVNTIGKTLNSSSDKVDTMMINATRYTARQFVDRIRGNYHSPEEYEMKEENLMSYEQFQMEFDRQQPQSSLLFDTGSGYFAFCVIAPHILESTSAPSIKADNAMTEIQKYLKESCQENEKSRKKKILIVDDSKLMRQAMTDLFSGDYAVSSANSGLAAIRCITLDRPDLVLLDYEMPVCDGRQVLEMIRSEKEIADIPVIFLTSKTDRESVSKVIALKPADYLLKSMKLEDIKKNVDKYFARTAAV